MSREETHKFFDEIRKMDDSPDWGKIAIVAKEKTHYEQEIKDELFKLATTISEHKDVLLRGEITVGPEFEDEPMYSTQEAINNLKRQFLKELESEDFISKLNFKSQRDSVSETDFLIAFFSYIPSSITVDLPKLTDRRTKQSRLRQQVARAEKHSFPHKLPRGLKWENFTIFFLDFRKVRIQVHGITHDADFIEMGFQDKKFKIPQPNLQWGLLMILSQNHGELTQMNPEAKETRKKQIELLAKSLQKYFKKMEADPFEPYKKGFGYKIRLTLGFPEFIENIYHSQETASEESAFDEEMHKHDNGI